jgi:hypothetical protein
MFLSHTFSEQARKWATIEQEAFAIFYFIVIKLHNILQGHHFTLETDHRNLVWLYNSETPKLVRWKLRLQEFDFKIVHIPGKTNIIADCISRLCAMSEEKLKNNEILAAYHNAYIGHHGSNATVKMLQSEGHNWEDMKTDVQNFIAACPTCQKVRLGQGSVEAAMNVRASMEPFQELEIDFVGPLQPDEDGNTFILVVVCCFTRVCELFPCKGATSKDTARSLLSVFSRYGLCTTLRSDNGSHFANHIVNDLLKLLNVEHRCGIPYRSQIQGIVERLNQEIMRHLRAIIFDCRVINQWSMYLPFIQRIINNTYHSVIGTRPTRLLFGDNITVNRNLLVNT